MTKSKQFLSDIEQACGALEAWRRTRQHRQPIPESLWSAMAKVAGVYGVSRVSQALRVGYYALKRRVAGSELQKPAGARAAFLEVSLPSAPDPSGCVIEWENRGGARMTLRLGPGNNSQVLALAEAFWRPQP